MSTNNIHPTAIIAKEAKLGENITVGPYSIIGPEVVIGNGTTVESHVVIEGETIIGDLYVLGRPLKAHVIAIKAGHFVNAKLTVLIAEKYLK